MRWWSRGRSMSWPCATTCCRDFRKPTCRRRRQRRNRVRNLQRRQCVLEVRQSLRQRRRHQERRVHNAGEDKQLAITRRQFLRRSAIAVAATGFNASPLSGAVRSIVLSGPARKVLILGAGMAGLVAAYELTRLGHDVTVLEARARPGGRVHTLHEPFSDGLYAEAGAARIPENHDLTLKYVKEFSLPLEPFYPQRLNTLRFDRGRREEVPIDGFTDAMTRHFGGELGGNPERWQKIKG